jgi:hypothetical protein
MSNTTPSPAVPTDQAADSAPVQARTAPATDAPALPVLKSTPVEEKPAVPTLITSPLSGENWDFALPSTETQKQIQETLAALEIYPGRKNGKWGDLTVASIQEAVHVPVDRIPSYELCAAVREATDRSSIGDKAVLDQATWDDFAKKLSEGL